MEDIRYLYPMPERGDKARSGEWEAIDIPVIISLKEDGTVEWRYIQRPVTFYRTAQDGSRKDEETKFERSGRRECAKGSSVYMSDGELRVI